MFDYLIQNARILDGSGGPVRQGGVALSSGHIAAVGAAHGHDGCSSPGCPGPVSHSPVFWISTATRMTPSSVPAGAGRSCARG